MNRRVKRVLLLVVLVLVINLPVVHSAWTQRQVATDGVEVTATVVDGRVLGGDDDPRYWLAFTFPRDIDERQSEWPAEVDETTYDRAMATRSLEVRVLEDNPAGYRADGQIVRRLGLVITLIADGVLLLIVLFAWRFGSRYRPQPPLRAAAIGDVERCPPGAVLERIEGTLYLIRGEVVALSGDEVTLEVGDRDVVVLLDGHQNPVGYQQPAQVRARMLE